MKGRIGCQELEDGFVREEGDLYMSVSNPVFLEEGDFI